MQWEAFMTNLINSLVKQFQVRKLILILVILLLSACSSINTSSLLPDPSIKEFRQLYVAKGDFLFAGYSSAEINKAATAEQTIQKFGNPKKSEEGNVIGNTIKLLYFEAKDDFGNPCFARLHFLCLCKNKDAPTPDCYYLIGIETVAK